MKVFLSWSGEKSHKVAITFRDWLPSVLQCLVPYVSSEDIDKGTRWSTDIAKELEDSTFGILCVTKENLNAPWLMFEAGALSKTMEKSFVSPFLFDIKRSEVNGPILQFQSTVFEEDDVNKLLKTLNKACGEDQLTDERLDRAFKVWWPTLKQELEKVADFREKEPANKPASKGVNEILEEILDLTRLNQKLLRNPESDATKVVLDMQQHIKELQERLEKERHMRMRRKRKIHPGMLEDLLHMGPKFGNRNLAFQIALSLFKDDFPWLYDAGMDVSKVLNSSKPAEEKDKAVHEFMALVEFSFEHPFMRETMLPDKENYMMLRELPYILKSSLKY